MKRKSRRIVPKAEINVTPFIDILLVLLVIFMTITPTTPAGLNADVPQKSADKAGETETAIILSIDRGGLIRINREEVEPGHLIERLREIFKARNDRTIYVQGADELLFNDVVQLIDAATGAGATRIGLIEIEPKQF